MLLDCLYSCKKILVNCFVVHHKIGVSKLITLAKKVKQQNWRNEKGKQRSNCSCLYVNNSILKVTVLTL